MDGPGYTSASSASAHTATSHRRKLIKKPPSYFGRSSSGFDGGAFDAQSLESKRSSQSLKRAPSAPPARSNPATVSDWQDSDRSHPQLSANNTLRPVPSPISPQGDLTPANHWAPVPRHSDRLSDSHLRPLNSPGIHDDLIGAPFDGAGLLSSIESIKIPSPKSQAPAPRHFPPQIVKAPVDAKIASPALRTANSFSAMDSTMNEKGLGPRAPTDGPSVNPKRYSDDGKDSKPAVLRKKSGFSGFMNSLVGSPKKPVISAPENPVHVTHVGYDSSTGQFTGLPKEWQRLINESGIPEKERRENPQTMVDILQFYKETTERPPEDQVLEKFHHAGQYATSPAAAASPGMYPSNYMGSFENPRAPPPVPRGQVGKDLMPSRPAPKPPVSMGNRHMPHGTYATKDSGIGMSQSGDESYGPSKDAGPMLPEEHRSRSNSRATGPTYAPTAPQPNPQLAQAQAAAYQQQLMQQQQEQAMAQAQAAMSGGIGRAPSKRAPNHHHHQNPNVQAAPGYGQPNGMHSASRQQAPQAAVPGARPRHRARQSAGIDIIASLKRICSEGDPRDIYRGEKEDISLSWYA
jgi:p21-activated kinase 1